MIDHDSRYNCRRSGLSSDEMFFFSIVGWECAFISNFWYIFHHCIRLINDHDQCVRAPVCQVYPQQIDGDLSQPVGELSLRYHSYIRPMTYLILDYQSGYEWVQVGLFYVIKPNEGLTTVQVLCGFPDSCGSIPAQQETWLDFLDIFGQCVFSDLIHLLMSVIIFRSRHVKYTRCK